MPRYKIADVVFDAKLIYKYTEKLCKNYEYSGEEQPLFTAVITDDDVALEKQKAPEFPEPYLESLALFRKLYHYCTAVKFKWNNFSQQCNNG